MAEADLSKIVNLIMENPGLIEQIKKLGASDGGNDASSSVEQSNAPDETTDTAPKLPTYEEKRQNTHSSKRKELLYAIKPYLSSERGKAIETMLSLADILDMMKTR